MPRPMRMRKVCCMPENAQFGPLHGSHRQSDFIELQVDEFETMRLLDYEGLTQEEAAKYMNITRTTVTAIYESARKKLIRSLVEGIPLEIKGGHFELYNEQERQMTGNHWRHHCCHTTKNET